MTLSTQVSPSLSEQTIVVCDARRENGVLEEWRDVIGYEGLYEVSNYGRVRSVSRWVSNNTAKRYVKGRILKDCFHRYGYRDVCLSKNNQHKLYKVHRIVACAFIKNILLKPYINHKNGITNDNRLDNLEWCTQKENVLHGIYRRKKL